MSYATLDGQESKPSTSSATVQWSLPCLQFGYTEIQLATDDFNESRVIGRGGFGKVYRGTIFQGSTDDPVDVAIKRLDSSSNQGAPEFWTEVEMLSKLRHCHLVSLYGYCNHGKEMILVYEYMPNRTLDDHLHKLGTPLSWIQRLKICIGAARGLHYLHTGTGIEFGVIHRDVKSSNILLHESWAAKIADFGLSRIAPTNQPSTYVNTHVKGTFGYIDPDYFFTGRLTRKSDVYAFGVVLLEVLCRKRAVDSSLDEEQWNLARWAEESIKKGYLKQIIDSDMRSQISQKCLKEFVRILERCLLSNPKQRSTMAEVVVGLESVLALQEKVNSSLQAAGKTIFGRMVDKFSFPFKGAQDDSKPSTNSSSDGTGEIPTDDREFTSDYRVQIFKEFNDAGFYRLVKLSGLIYFEFGALKRATSNFSQDMILDWGGFGLVFLGWVKKDTFAPSKRRDGIAVAVKRIPQPINIDRVEKWMEEVNLLGRLSHPNIISLLGFCNDTQNELLIVYECMQNLSFDHFLYGKALDHKPLSWGTRLTIMIGVACGLAYLHSLKVIHHDVKSSNILLDQDFKAKLWDFGVAKVCFETRKTHITTLFMGSIGYVDPDYVETGCFSVKSDIYGFGVVLLETLMGQRVVDDMRPKGQQNLTLWTRPFLAQKSELKKIMDPRLEENYPLEGAFECAALALRCLALKPADRPSSEEVFQSLEQIYALHK